MAVSTNHQPFTISVVGESTGETYRADFLCTRILSHRQHLLRDRLYREYLGGENPAFADEDSKTRARILSEINASLIQPVPQFWRESGSGLDLLDNNVLIDVHAGVIRAQNDAVQERMKKEEASKEKLKGAVEKSEEVKKAEEKAAAEE